MRLTFYYYIIPCLLLASCKQDHRPDAAVPRELAGRYSMYLSQSLSDARSGGREIWESEVDDSYSEYIQTRFFSRASYELDGSRIQTILLSGEKQDSAEVDSIVRICQQKYGDGGRISRYGSHITRMWKLADRTFAYVYYYPTMHEIPQRTFTALFYIGPYPESQWDSLESSQ